MKGLHGLLLSIHVFICGLYLPCKGQSYNQSMDLLGNVFRNYDRRLRPTLNQSLPVHVNVTFTLLNIEDFDEVAGKFAVTGALLITWNDEKITWNATDYGGVHFLTFPLTEVWYPVLILLYPHGKYDDFADDWMTVRILNNGDAFLAPGAVFKTTCSVDVTYYPFDIQTCSLVFYPWNYSQEEVKLTIPDQYIDMTYFIEHGEWSIVGTSSVSERLHGYARFTFKIKRKPMFFVINIICPIVLMSLLNILIFALPPESGERISYGITVLLAIAVFLTIIGDNLPKTSNPMSVLSYFLMVNLFLSALMCMSAILNLRVYFTNDREPFTSWALFIIRVAKDGSRRPPPKLTHFETENTDAGNEIFCDDKSVNLSDGCAYKIWTWRDLSETIDKLCIMFFSLVVVINTVIFVVIVTHGPH